MTNKNQPVILDGILCGSKSSYSPSPNLPQVRNKRNDTVMLHGKEWYQYFIPQKYFYSLTDKIGPNEINKKFIVCAHVPKPNAKEGAKPMRIFSAFDSALDFFYYIKDIPQDRWVFFEYIMSDQVQKLYFDVDIKVENLVKVGIITNPEDPNHCKQQLDTFGTQLISSLIGQIVTVFTKLGYPIDIAKQILLFTSHSNIKRSYHIVVNGYAVSNCEENEILAQDILKDFPDYIFKYRIIDRLFSSRQQFRLLHSQKAGSGRPKIFVNKWYYGDTLIEYKHQEELQPIVRFTTLFQASCVTYIESCQVIPISCSEDDPKKFRGRYRSWAEMGTFDDEEEVKVTEEIVDVIYKRVDPKMFDIYKFDRDRVTGSFIWMNRKTELIGTEIMCTLCGRTHSSIGAFLRVDKYGKVYFHCYGTDDAKKTVADVTDLLQIGKELEFNQKQSILNQLTKKNVVTPPSPSKLIMAPPTMPTTITLHSQMRLMAAGSF
jgi:hypothetical protein